jgi:hypothetical protein
MGVLSDFLLAPRHLSDDHLVEHPEDAIARVESRRVDPLQLENLAAAIGLGLEVGDPVAAVDEEGPWLLALPPGLVAALADAGPDALERWSETWSRADEWWTSSPADRRAVASSLRALLASLVPLAARARAGEGRLLLWVSL